MTDTITLIGFVATPPKHLITGEGLPITSFRLASTQRRFDRAQGRWSDGDTNWYTVTAFRQLAINAVSSVAKGDRVVVTGRLRIRSWEVGDRAGTTVDVEADAVGHDLAWGTTAFTRTIVSTAVDSSVSGTSASETSATEPSATGSSAATSEEQQLETSGEDVFPEPQRETENAESIAVPF